MTAIEEMAGMDVICSDKTGTLTLNRLSVDKSLIEVVQKDVCFRLNLKILYCIVIVPTIFLDVFSQVFARGVDADTVVLMAARASRVENQDAIDTAIVGMLADPKEVCQLVYERSKEQYIGWKCKFRLLIRNS